MRTLDRFDTTTKQKAYDTVSVSSLQGPNATKIKVPYRNVIEIQRVGAPALSRQQEQMGQQRHQRQQRQQQAKANAVEKSSSEMSFQEDIESLSKRLANIQSERQPPSGDNGDQHERKHFDYKTLVANVQATPSQSNKQIIDAYSVNTLEQNSPFQQAILIKDNQNRRLTNLETDSGFDNSNERTFTLDDYYVKYRATPALVDESQLLTGGKSSHCDQNDKPSTSSGMEDDDRMSQVSSCSLQSSRTYKIRTIGQAPDAGQASHQRKPDKQQDRSNGQRQEKPQERPIDFDENGNNKRPAAWIFDPRDGSSTAIVPPARPKRPETPEIDAKTEELAQSRGGRSYYLELIEPAGTGSGNLMTRAAKRQRPGSMDSLYSRWTSQGALNSSTPTAPAHRPLAPIQVKSPQQVYRSTKELNSTIAQLEQNRYLNRANLMDPWDQQQQQQQQQQTATRRQLPFGGSPPSLGDKSKSSSCLLTVTKPSKYSIYGGFRKPGESSKPVPRLSYSRAIGPRSQRKDQNAPKTPSRYLKMR